MTHGNQAPSNPPIPHQIRALATRNRRNPRSESRSLCATRARPRPSTANGLAMVPRQHPNAGLGGHANSELAKTQITTTKRLHSTVRLACHNPDNVTAKTHSRFIHKKHPSRRTRSFHPPSIPRPFLTALSSLDLSPKENNAPRARRMHQRKSRVPRSITNSKNVLTGSHVTRCGVHHPHTHGKRIGGISTGI